MSRIPDSTTFFKPWRLGLIALITVLSIAGFSVALTLYPEPDQIHIQSALVLCWTFVVIFTTKTLGQWGERLAFDGDLEGEQMEDNNDITPHKLHDRCLELSKCAPTGFDPEIQSWIDQSATALGEAGKILLLQVEARERCARSLFARMPPTDNPTQFEEDR